MIHTLLNTTNYFTNQHEHRNHQRVISVAKGIEIGIRKTFFRLSLSSQKAFFHLLCV